MKKFKDSDFLAILELCYAPIYLTGVILVGKIRAIRYNLKLTYHSIFRK